MKFCKNYYSMFSYNTKNMKLGMPTQHLCLTESKGKNHHFHAYVAIVFTMNTSLLCDYPLSITHIIKTFVVTYACPNL